MGTPASRALPALFPNGSPRDQPRSAGADQDRRKRGDAVLKTKKRLSGSSGGGGSAEHRSVCADAQTRLVIDGLSSEARLAVDPPVSGRGLRQRAPDCDGCDPGVGERRLSAFPAPPPSQSSWSLPRGRPRRGALTSFPMRNRAGLAKASGQGSKRVSGDLRNAFGSLDLPSLEKVPGG